MRNSCKKTLILLSEMDTSKKGEPKLSFFVCVNFIISRFQKGLNLLPFLKIIFLSDIHS